MHTTEIAMHDESHRTFLETALDCIGTPKMGIWHRDLAPPPIGMPSAQRHHRRVLPVCTLADTDYDDKDARRLANRLSRTRDHLWTFLDEPAVPFENNFAERMIRPAVILRKNGQSNRSEQGAATQAVLMNIYRTLRLRGLNPTKTIADALKTYLTNGQLLPPLISIPAHG